MKIVLIQFQNSKRWKVDQIDLDLFWNYIKMISVISEVYQNDFGVILKVDQTGLHKKVYLVLSRAKSA